MAGPRPVRSTASCFSSPPPPSFHSHLLLLLTIISFLVATFAFVLQWHGELPDQISRLPSDHHELLDKAQTRHIPPSSSSSDCADNLRQSHMPSFPYYKNLKFNVETGDGSDYNTKVCITTTTSTGLEQILPWLFYHKVVGVTKFFLFVEGKAASANASKVMESIPGVKVIKRTRESEEQQAKSRIWRETWLEEFFYKPCNYELFVKQSLNMEMAIVMGREAGMDWIVHLDTDELLHPAGTSDYSVQQFLSDIPKNVDTMVFPNYESTVERDDIKEPFSEVSMFKKGFNHLDNETFYGSFDEASRGNPSYFLTYGNGKSAARIQDHLRPNGAHRWSNYMKDPVYINVIQEIYSDEAAVLHYSYAKFSDLTSRRDRCHCKPTEEDIKRCFMLAFDRNAFIIASTATEEEMLFWYRKHVVWTDKELINKLLKNGVLTRIYAPMIIVQGLREAGIFTSIISSALSNLSNSQFSSSVEHDELSRTIMDMVSFEQ